MKSPEMPIVIGCDEAGFGSWAGPLYVCAVAVPTDWNTKGLADSKLLSRHQIWELYEVLKMLPHSVQVGSVEAINAGGVVTVLKALQEVAFQELLEKFPKATAILNDGEDLDLAKVWSVPHADQFVPAVMAGAAVAKHLRDLHMISLSVDCPQYDWQNNVGYGTARHIEALSRHGACKHHRLYKPVRDVIENGVLSVDSPGVQPVSDALYAKWRKR